jgi:hypothetical protein
MVEEEYLVQILLPVRDNDGQPFANDPHGATRRELLDRFGGVTAHQRAPAHGLWATPEGLQWRWGGENEGSFKAYHDFQDGQWRKLFPQRQDAPWSYSGFPCEGDVFKISVAGNRVTATHEHSGAQWMLEVPQDGATTAPSVAGSN